MKRFLLSLLLTLPATAQPPIDYSNPQIRTLISNGSPAQKVDLVFVGDGYTASQMKDLERDARAAADSLFSYPLFKDYKSYFNVHVAHVPSIAETGGKMRFAFGSKRNESRGLVLLENKDKVWGVVSKAPACDVPIVISTVPGRAHASDIVCLPGRSYEPLAHELGHFIGKLGDEYDSNSMLNDRYPNPSGRDLDYPNLSLDGYIDPANRETIRKTAKWGHFLDLPGAFPLVSAYQGGNHQVIGVWRPTFSCIMGQDGAPFCPVCHFHMVKAIHSKCGLTFDEAAYRRRHPLSQWK
jgi:hypothetical protein